MSGKGFGRTRLQGATLVAASVLALSWSPTPGDTASHFHPQPPAGMAGPAPHAAASRAVGKRLSVRCRGLTDAEVAHLARAVVHAAVIHGFSPDLVLAVIEVESNYDPYAVSPVGAMGLMQLLPSTGAEMAHHLRVPWRGPRTLFDPVINVRLGIAYLRQLRDRYGSVGIALAAYNWGPGRIDAQLRRGEPLPQRYPRLVLAAYSDRRGERETGS